MTYLTDPGWVCLHRVEHLHQAKNTKDRNGTKDDRTMGLK